MTITSSRQLFRFSRIRRLVALGGTRGNATRTEGWGARSPRELYDHLSQYIIGQEKAKRTLSVAVFNHYHRIAPRLPSQPDTAPPPSQTVPNIQPARSSRTSSSSSSSPFSTRSTDTANPSSSSPSQADYTTLDPSRPGSELDDGLRRDITKATGSIEGSDPTLTHDLVSSRSREGQWGKLNRMPQDHQAGQIADRLARDGYFSSRSPPPPSMLGKAMRQRKLPELDQVSRDGPAQNLDAGEQARSMAAAVPPKLDKGKGREEVVIEKSNVLMIGPTGTGKTLLAKTLARILDVPFASCDATSYTQAGYVGEDVENCVLRLLQAAEYDVNRTEIGIIHIDEIDKLARRGGADFGSWGGGRDVGGEGVQQALLRLLEGTTLTLSAKPPAISSSSQTPTSSSTSSNPPHPSPKASPSGTGSGSGPGHKSESSSTAPGSNAFGAAYDPPGWDPNNPMNRGFGASAGAGAGGKKGVREGLPGFGGGSGGSGSGKGETFMVDTSNILFILSGAFVGLESIVHRRLGKGSIGFGAPLPSPPMSDSSSPSSQPVSLTPLKGLATPDLATYGLIPEFLGRLPILSTLHPLSIDDLVRILTEPRNALIKQYEAMFDKYGSELQFTQKAVREIAQVGLERGGGARGLRGVLEEVLGDAMFEVPGSSVRYCLITANAVRSLEPAMYFSRGQKHLYHQAIEDEDAELLRSGQENEGAPEDEEEKMMATG